MKEYGLYDIKDYEQCVCIGTISKIEKFLGKRANSLHEHLNRKRKGEVKYIHQRYDLVEIGGKNERNIRNNKL